MGEDHNPDELEDGQDTSQVEDKTLESKDNKAIPTSNHSYYVEESLDWVQMTNGDAEGIFKLKAFTRDGDLNWSRSWDGIPLTQIDVIYDIVIDGSFLYLALENHIYKLDLNKGEEIWSLDMGGVNQLHIYKDRLYSGFSFASGLLKSKN